MKDQEKTQDSNLDIDEVGTSDLNSNKLNIDEIEQDQCCQEPNNIASIGETLAGANNPPNLEDQLSEINTKYLYAMAELDNTRKRHIKERSELLKYAGESLARDFLEVLDDLERASTQPVTTDVTTVLEGVSLISNRMRSLFERHGIKSEDCLGKSFDPKKHEALTMSPSSVEDSGKILQQISRCYFFKDKLLRPGQVIVGSGEQSEEKT